VYIHTLRLIMAIVEMNDSFRLQHICIWLSLIDWWHRAHSWGVMANDPTELRKCSAEMCKPIYAPYIGLWLCRCHEIMVRLHRRRPTLLFMRWQAHIEFIRCIPTCELVYSGIIHTDYLVVRFRQLMLPPLQSRCQKNDQQPLISPITLWPSIR